MTWDWLDKGTAILWLMLAILGVSLRLRRLHRLRQIVVITPTDRDYLASIKRSTYIRLAVKTVLLVGAWATVAGLDVPPLVSRLGVLVMLVLMVWETTSVDKVRERLGRSLR